MYQICRCRQKVKVANVFDSEVTKQANVTFALNTKSDAFGWSLRLAIDIVGVNSLSFVSKRR